MKLKMHTVITYTLSHKFGSSLSKSPEEKRNDLVLGTLFTMSKRKRTSQIAQDYLVPINSQLQKLG